MTAHDKDGQMGRYGQQAKMLELHSSGVGACLEIESALEKPMVATMP
jgi:hypothetical protein